MRPYLELRHCDLIRQRSRPHKRSAAQRRRVETLRQSASDSTVPTTLQIHIPTVPCLSSSQVSASAWASLAAGSCRRTCGRPTDYSPCFLPLSIPLPIRTHARLIIIGVATVAPA